MTPELDYAFAMGFFVGSPERYQREMTKAERKSLANQYARIFNGRHHWKSREHLESICWRIRRRIEYTPPTRATVGRAQPEEAPKVQDAEQEQFFATDEDAAQESYLMVEGEGAPQYTFLPAQDAQLCLF